MFFYEIQDVFLGFGGEARIIALAVFVRTLGNGSPQVVDLLLQVLFAVFLAPPLFFSGDRIGALVAVHAVVHQGVAGIEQVLDGINAMALLALHDVLLGEHQVVDDRAGIGPGAEQVVALEETVMAVAGVSHHQGLHAHGVFFHQVGDARVGIDHDFVGQPHLPPAVRFFRAEEMFAVGPVVITQWHAYRSIGIHHLFSGNDLDLVRVGIQGIALGNTADFPVVRLDKFKGPF
ncbi:hypothetical protein D9M71_219110 [compost metagenome]